MAHSPHRRWKGCRVCTPYKIRGAGRAYKESVSTMRRIGKLRRLRRHDLGDAADY